jgi:ribosomal protein L37AE/L43A
MRDSSLVSRSDSFVCPLCEASQLYPSGQGSMTCQSCNTQLQGAMLGTLRSISTLPDTLGSHACECGHPEMRRLPDGTYHCPSCGSEVAPAEVPSTASKSEERGLAYWSGWADGRFGERGSFVDNTNLARWEAPPDRLAYYRGHRASSEARQSRDDRNPDTHEKLFGF